MDTDKAVPVPNLFMPHPNLSDGVNRNIVQSEIEGGVHLDKLSEGEVLEIENQNRWYTVLEGLFRSMTGPKFLGRPRRVAWRQRPLQSAPEDRTGKLERLCKLKGPVEEV